MALASALLLACGNSELDVEADALPGLYPNQLGSSDRELSFALLAPRLRSDGYSPAAQEPGSDLIVQPTVESALARVEGREGKVANLGPIQWRDVNDDGLEDIVVNFSVAELRGAGLLDAGGTRLRVDVHVGGQATWSGSDRVFAPEAAVVRLPAFSGPYAVGTSSDFLLDRSRDRVREPGRPLFVRAWYPAIGSRGQPTDYFLVPETAGAITERLGVAANTFDAVHAFSLHGAGPAALELPTLLLSTGAGVPLDSYAALAEDLASHGFVVVGVGHPDGASGPISYADGSISEDVALSVIQALEPVARPTAPDEELAAAANLACARDLLFVLDCLEPEADCGLSRGLRAALASADVRRVGALGHSFGGSAAVWADLLSERITASANLDGALWGAPLTQGWQGRVLVLQSDELAAQPEASNLPRFLAQSQGTTFVAHIAGSTHDQFSDVGLLASGLPQLAQAVGTPAAELSPLRVIEIKNAYVRSFFAQELSGEPSALLGGARPEFPEVSLEIRRQLAEATEP